MAVEIVTREMVYDLLVEFKKGKKKKKDLRTFLTEELGDHATTHVDTHARDGRGPSTPLMDLIMDDISSYGLIDGE